MSMEWPGVQAQQSMYRLAHFKFGRQLGRLAISPKISPPTPKSVNNLDRAAERVRPKRVNKIIFVKPVKVP